MNIHKWAVSHPSILEGSQVTPLEGPKRFTEHAEDHGTTLGLLWHGDDSMGFQVPQVVTSSYTKRSVLSLNNSLFDPHGLLLPFRMSGRMLFNQVCLIKPPLTWDQTLPPALQKDWQTWESQLAHLTSLKVPRWLGLESPHQLHIFADASGAAFGACAYTVTDQGSNLVAAKAHLRRSHMQTIPRLELDAALEGNATGAKIRSVVRVCTRKNPLLERFH